MRTEKEWKKALNVSDENYDQWKSTCQEPSLTLWALKNDKIKLGEYMEWAIDHYSTPYLKDSFLYTNPINKELWNEVKNAMEWNETLVPLYSWENKIFVGCVEPPQINSKNCVPLLTSPKILEFCWNKVQKFSNQKTTDTENIVNYTMKNIENIEHIEAIENTEHIKDTEHDENIAETIANIANDSDTGDIEHIDESMKEDHTKEASHKVTIIENITSIFSKKKTAPPSEKVYAHVFTKTKKYFSATIIFSFKNQKYTPVKWSQSIKETTKPIDIKEPSLFRMLTLSNTPHHGVLMRNPQHEQYFKEWGYSKLPKHVSLIPIHNKSDQLCGAFLGVLRSSFIQRKYLNKIIQAIQPLKEALSTPDNEDLLKAA